MLKYFKQKGQKLTATNNESRHKSDDIHSADDEYEYDIDSAFVGDIFMCQSRLSMSLPAIVGNPSCLSYFVQYLERRQALPLLKFYLDTENFKTAALAQLEQERRQSLLRHTTAAAPDGGTPKASDEDAGSGGGIGIGVGVDEENGSDEERDERDNSVPELKTLCESTMCKPLTDDEKSQICAANSRQLRYHKAQPTQLCSTSSELSLCSETTNTIWTNGDAGGGIGVLPISAASVRDAMAIYQKYLRNDAKYCVTLPVGVLAEISLLLCRRPDDATAASDAAERERCNDVSASCFAEAQAYVLQQLERDHLHEFLQSSFYCRYCLELIEGNGNGSGTTEDPLNICDVLHSEMALFFFMEYLEQRGERRECLDFWTAAINFRRSCPLQRHTAEMQADAMIIYDKYISLQSPTRLRLLDKLRSHVEERICDDGGMEAVAHCFDLPLQLVVRHLERKHFDEFLKSQLFQNYINELKSKAHEDGSAGGGAGCGVTAITPTTPNAIVNVRRRLSLRRSNSNATPRALRHRKTMSDCTSTHNTLLASMDSSVKHIQTAAGSTNLNIDARQLTNPNLLWHRRCSTGANNGGLQFGYVNALGRYERDFATTMDALAHGSIVDGMRQAASGSGWSLKNAVRKLVHLPSEDRLQEEIAWQMAEMIVRDVTNVTLRGGDGGSGAGGATTP